jgi:hypothetical protein
MHATGKLACVEGMDGQCDGHHHHRRWRAVVAGGGKMFDVCFQVMLPVFSCPAVRTWRYSMLPHACQALMLGMLWFV